MTEQTKPASAVAKQADKAPEKSQYQKQKDAEQLVNGLDSAERKRVFNVLLASWAAGLPQKGKDYGVTGSGNKWLERLEWLQDQLGTPTKGKDTIRKMSLSSVLELLTLFALQAADSKEDKLSFGVLDNGSKLAEALVPQLRAMKDEVGPKLEVRRSTYAQMKQLQEDREAMTREEFDKRYDEIMKQIDA